jgi:transposase
VRDLLRSAPALHADETPGRSAGSLRYLHVAYTRYLTLMHSGDRSAAAIDADGVLPGYAGILVRDGYPGYAHLISALHAWCCAHYPDTVVMPIPGGRCRLAAVAGSGISA